MWGEKVAAGRGFRDYGWNSRERKNIAMWVSEMLEFQNGRNFTLKIL